MALPHRLKNLPFIIEAVGETRSLFKSAYSLAGEAILEKLERRISRRPDSAEWLGRTDEGEELRQLKEVFQIGNEVIMCEVVFKIDPDYKVADWIIFRYGHSNPD